MADDLHQNDTTRFDTRAKLLLQNSVPALLRVLKLDTPADYDWVSEPVESPLVLHKRADFVLRNRQTNRLLHVELQTDADSDMLQRCFAYASTYFMKYKILPKQFVLHLGAGPAAYETKYENEDNIFRIHVVDLKNIPADLFLEDGSPDALVFAVLGESASPEQLVETVVRRLTDLRLGNNRLNDYISILDTLGELRALHDIINEKRKDIMSFHIDISNTFAYQEGELKGELKGKTIGRQETLAELVHGMWREGDSLEKIARVTHKTVEEVQAILNRPQA